MFSREEIRERLTFSIPSFWQDILEMRNIQDRGADELSKFAIEFFRYIDSRSALTADSKKIVKWERMLGIVPDDTKTLTERRSVVMSKLRGIGTVTKELVETTAESFEFGDVEVIEGEGYVIIRFVSELGLPPDMEDIEAALREIIPAHLEIRYEFKYNTYGIMKATTKTYAQLKASGI